ncbi:hypothetical protein O9929_14730 [Vibrio lentus]|nr:hypothetical protein [Vibrio lentus]
MVLRLKNLDEVIFTIQKLSRTRHSFYSALRVPASGQAVSDSVIITLTDDWRGHEIVDNGNQIILQPGVIGADANKYLAPFQRKTAQTQPLSIPVKSVALQRITPVVCVVVPRKTRIANCREHENRIGGWPRLIRLTTQVLRHSSNRTKNCLKALLNYINRQRQNQELADRIRHKYRLKKHHWLRSECLG